MGQTDIKVSSLNDANEIIKEQDRLLGELIRENAALKLKADMYDDLFTIKKLLDEKFPDSYKV